MASPSTPSTPISAMANTVVSSDPAGTWTHPRMDEINRRMKATSLGDQNIRTIFGNLLALFVSVLLPRVLSVMPYPINQTIDATAPWSEYALVACRAALMMFIAIACLPLLRAKDDLADIPLTPQQRKLLGLPLTSKPATPGSTYITPPRYSRSATPRSDASSRSNSPYSGGTRASPLGTTSYSPSPLFQKAMNRDVTRRLSFGAGGNQSQQPLGAGRAGNEQLRIASNTPSPKTGQSSGVSLNSRWLYEKGRTSSASRRMYS